MSNLDEVMEIVRRLDGAPSELVAELEESVSAMLFLVEEVRNHQADLLDLANRQEALIRFVLSHVRTADRVEFCRSVQETIEEL